jgi:hypothetical protein
MRLPLVLGISPVGDPRSILLEKITTTQAASGMARLAA